MASSVENNQQSNFNPAWMKSAFNGGGGGAGYGGAGGGGNGVNGSVFVTRVLGGPPEDQAYPMADPIFAQHRYGREDLLALIHKDAHPNGLDKCETLFVADHQPPISITPLSEIEQRLQTNINSSKATSSLPPAERAQVLQGGALASNGGVGPHRSQPPVAGGGGGWTPVKSTTWSRGASHANRGGVSGGRGTGFGAGYGRGGGATGAGGYMPSGGGGPGTQPGTGGGVNEEGASSYGQRYVPRNARGAPPPGRGGSTAPPTFNSRAQGLYDPKDPKDRPRARLRSTSEDDVAAANGMSSVPANAWQQVRSSGQATGNNGTSTWGQCRNPSDSSQLPEWMNDSDDDSGAGVAREARDDRSVPAVSGSFAEEPPSYRPELERPAWARQVSASVISDGLSRSESARVEQYQPGISSAPTTSAAMMGGGAAPSVPHGFAPLQPMPNYAPSQPVAPPTPPKFFYMDPTKTERGPFEKEQMDQWMKSGYFEPTLQVRRDRDTDFKTLGELMQIHGATTPFDYKEPSPPPQPQIQQTHAPFAYPTSEPLKSGWNGDRVAGGGGSLPFGSYGLDQSALQLERLRIEEDNRRMRQQQEAYEKLIRETQEREAERLRQWQEREAQLHQFQEEIRRRETTLHETAKQIEERLERERQQVAEKEKRVQMERERVEREMEEARRKVEEEARSKQEAEERERAAAEEAERQRRRADEEREREKERERQRKLQEEERKKRAEAAAEEERRRLEQAAKQAAEQIRIKEEADRRRREAEEAAAYQSQEEEPPAQYVVTEDWEVAGKPKREDKRTPKAAPWSAQAAATPPREKSMKDILEEEARQAEAERRQVEQQRKEDARLQQSLQSAGTWNNAAARLATSAAAQRPSAGGSSSVWATTQSSEPARINPLLDGPPLSSSAAKKPAQQPVKKPAPKPAVQAAPKPQKAAAPTFHQWAVQKMRTINSDIDADFLYSIVHDVVSPNEVEDYIVGNMGNTKAVKEFVKEYIKKRSDTRAGKAIEQTTTSGGSEWATASQAGKKKKGKGRALVVDGSCLGFTPAADSNRTNKGEIETVAMQPGQRR